MKRAVLILAGGKGTRLWPVSRENYPKFFLKIASEKSMLQAAVLRGVKLAGANLSRRVLGTVPNIRFLLKGYVCHF